MDKRFAIFDMDGTLVDSMAYWKNLAAEFLERKGIQSVSADILEQIKPMTMSESAALFIEKYGLPQDWNDDGAHGPERYIEVHVWSDDVIGRYLY